MKPANNPSTESHDDMTARTIDDALNLLKQGKTFEKEGKLWEAADQFIDGCRILQTLAQQQSTETEEGRQIFALYNEKSKEYTRQSRKNLLEAIKLEVEHDEKDEEYYKNLKDDDAELRIRVFSSLLGKTLERKDIEKETSEQLWSIEQRLQELNASLPSGFQTDEEKMDAINRGLNRLGLSLYTQKRPFERFQDTLPKSDEEQIEDIIAQAEDEVAFEKKFGTGAGGTGATSAGQSGFVEVEATDSEDTDSDSENDSTFDDEQILIKRIRKRISKCQVELSKLDALLDEAHAAKVDQARKDEDIAYDSDDDDDVEKPSVEMYMTSGKKQLKHAQKHLNQASQIWNEALLK